MIPNINIYSITLIIVTYHLSVTCSQIFTDGRVESPEYANNPETTVKKECYIPVANSDERPRPKHFHNVKSKKSTDPFFHADNGQLFQMSCDSGKTVRVRTDDIAPEVIVKCEMNKYRFRDRLYEYDDFTCVNSWHNALKQNSSSRSHLKREIGGYDCFLAMQGIDYFMPIPFTANTSTPVIIHPDINGYLIIPQNSYFKMACTGQGNEFVAPYANGMNEMTIKCLNGTVLEYNERTFSLLDFSCSSVPKSAVVVTKQKCDNDKYTVLEVGYQTNFYFLKQYKICFDMVTKNPKYSWYFANTPIYPIRQVAKTKMLYINSKMYGDFDPKQAYIDQFHRVATILESNKMAHYYMNKMKGRLVMPGHLMSKKEFVYIFEQWSTFFYENTVPQWYLYGKRLWKNLQITINNRLSRDFTRHLIVTGTYQVCHLQASANNLKPIYLQLPESLVVPNYIWKLDYDMDRKNGTVYVGLNNPYKKIDTSVYFCNAHPCPGRMLQRKAFENDLLFCCTKEDFEKAYGTLDPIIYQNFGK